jgi:hypothetical protein|tara:strand:+ start:282 stop:449 length:168 start_codon:yes stop_codon:yes gene_type:complete
LNPTPRETDEESEKAIKEFLAKGGVIEVCEPFARTENLEIKGGFYGRKPKKKEEE